MGNARRAGKRVVGRPFVKGKARPQNAGRRAGTPNKLTVEIKEFFREFMNSEEYRENLKKRLLDGRAPRIEQLGLYWLGGKPKEAVDINLAKDTVAGLLAAAHELRQEQKAGKG